MEISALNGYEIACKNTLREKLRIDLEDFYIAKMAKIANELLESHYSKIIKEWESIGES